MGARGVEQGWCQLEIPPRSSGYPHGVRFSLRQHPGTELILFRGLPKRAQPSLGFALHHFGGTLSLQGSPVGMELCGHGVGRGVVVQVGQDGQETG